MFSNKNAIRILLVRFLIYGKAHERATSTLPTLLKPGVSEAFGHIVLLRTCTKSSLHLYQRSPRHTWEYKTYSNRGALSKSFWYESRWIQWYGHHPSHRTHPQNITFLFSSSCTTVFSTYAFQFWYVSLKTLVIDENCTGLHWYDKNRG